MALDERFFLSPPLDQYFVDKDTGLPLANGTITFYRDSARTTPKAVYQVTGTPPDYTYTALTDPITLSAVGTIQNANDDNVALYFYPYEGTPAQNTGILDLYYIVCTNEDGIEQWTREGWPNVTAENDPTKEQFPIQNQIANPQFSRVFLNEGLDTTYTVSATTTRYSLAPDWDIELTSAGSGSVTVRRRAVAGTSNIPTSPPYVLDVSVASGTTCKLIQRFNTNSGLWASTDNEDIYLAANIVGINQNAGDAAIVMYYDESVGGSPVEILSGAVSNGSYSQIKGASADPIPASTNTDTGESGYVEVYVQLAASTHVYISSIQVVPTLSDAGANLIDYDTKSSNREQALMGDYYIPRLVAKPIPSILTGWDFPVNPAQFGEDQAVAATAGYLWDQTIGARVTGAVALTRNSVTGGMNFVNASATEAFYIMQYLEGKQAKKILSNGLSVNAVAYKGSVGSDVTMRVYMYRSIASYAECRLATVANLAGTYANGTLGVGATLTQTTGMSALSVDGVAVGSGDRILVKNQTNTFENGIYTVTNPGSGAAKWVLTRATDYDTAAEMLQGAIFPIAFSQGTNSNTTWSQDNVISVVGTDAVAFTASASVPLLPASIGSLASTGVFTLNTTAGQGLNWTLIDRNGLGTATATLPVVTTSDDLNDAIDTQFTGWKVTDATQISNTDKFAIVVTFQVPTDNTQVTIDSISVTPGDVPSRPAAKSYKETLEDCRYYYEKSYLPEDDPGSITSTGERQVQMQVMRQTSAVVYSVIASSFTCEYETKRKNPSITIYDPTSATANRIFAGDNTGGGYASTQSLVVFGTKYNLNSLSVDRGFLRTIEISAIFAPSSTVTNAEGVLRYHFVADARLGVV